MKTGHFVLAIVSLLQLSVQASWHELLQDNGFEQRSGYWTSYYLSGGDSLSAGIVNLGNAHTGSYYAYVGDFSTTHSNAVGVVRQLITLPACSTKATLNFFLNVTSQDTTATEHDRMGAYLRTYPGDMQVGTFHEWSNLNKDPNGIKNNYSPQNYTIDVSQYAGQQLILQFYGITDGSLSTTFRIDDVSVQAYVPDFTIGVIAGPNGSVTPSGNNTMECGGKFTMTASPSAGYVVDQWQINGTTVQTGGTVLTMMVNAMANVSVTFKPNQQTITVSTGVNGSVSPSGTFGATMGDILNLIATPDQGYTVSQWTVNGVEEQAGGNTFKITVTGDTTVNVTFKPTTYTISISADHGDVILDPPLTEFSYGGTVTFTPRPYPGYIFLEWGGDLNGGGTLTLPIHQSLNVVAHFIELSGAPVLTIANSTPPINPPPNPPEPGFTFQAIPGYKYVIYGLDKFPTSKLLSAWRPLTSVSVVFSQNVKWTFPQTQGKGGLYKLLQIPAINYAPFLSFPLTSGSSSTKPILAVLDHQITSGIHHDGTIVICTSELVSIETGPAVGYRTLDATAVLETVNNDPASPDYFQPFFAVGYSHDVNGTAFNLPFTYVGNDTAPVHLFYDDHTGYDYRTSSSDKVLAAAHGFVVPEECGTLDDNHQLVIKHDNGLKSYYLHLDSWDSSVAIDQNHAKAVEVQPGQIIGVPGKRGQAQGVHLHFELRRSFSDNTGGFELVDPYGSVAADGTQIQPKLWLNGQ